MIDTTIWVLILVGLGLLLGYLTSHSANNREQTQSGALAQLLNYLASALVAMVAPTVICNVLFIHPNFLGKVIVGGWNLTTLVHALLIALTMIVVALALLMVYATMEKPHLANLAEEEDKGWTREDAESSGL